ncbi:MAG: ADP-glyceromanno-heptose 6-epimerase [Dongiaceae bacterium]
MIIVTGGSGFIGSNLVAGLEAADHGQVIVCDQFGKSEKWRNVAKRNIAEFVEPDNLIEFLDDHASEINAIFHLGAVSSTTETDADLIVRNNFQLPLHLWRWCCRHGTRFIYASSAATYGDGGGGFDDNFSESVLSNIRPLNTYGWSKHAFDRRIAHIVKAGRNTPPQWAGLKFFNVYGPNEYHKGAQSSVVYQTYQKVSKGEPATLFKSHNPKYPDGGQLRDFIYVRDCVDVMLWLYENSKVNGLFNLGTGKARSFKDLAHSVFDALGKEPKINYIDTPPEIRSKYQYFTEAKMDRLRTAGYAKPFTSLEDGVKDYVQNYLTAVDPYK